MVFLPEKKKECIMPRNLNARCSSPLQRQLSQKYLNWLCFPSWRFTTQPNVGIDSSVPHYKTSNTASVFVLCMERWQSHKQVLCRGVGHRCQLQSWKPWPVSSPSYNCRLLQYQAKSRHIIMWMERTANCCSTLSVDDMWRQSLK